ncbi:hypothetical protein R1sor_017263 [Riccia sorocarpa]|uniref:Uncharacterized protein n=1 Tax=Riccia sorocarpa TaxID=122646 RepID=A0ABD3I7E4_9MARC
MERASAMKVGEPEFIWCRGTEANSPVEATLAEAENLATSLGKRYKSQEAQDSISRGATDLGRMRARHHLDRLQHWGLRLQPRGGSTREEDWNESRRTGIRGANEGHGDRERHLHASSAHNSRAELSNDNTSEENMHTLNELEVLGFREIREESWRAAGE